MTKSTPALLDTDILSAIMRKNSLATERARSYLETHRQFAFSVIHDTKCFVVCSLKGRQSNLPRLTSFVPQAEYCRSQMPS